MSWIKRICSAKMPEFKRCVYCRSFNTDRGHWSRGYNNDLRQATGGMGYYCNKCGKIEFIQSYSEYKKSLPKHITAYR